MQFLGITSSLFFTLLAALGGAIVLLYLVKLRRRRVQVPYGPLWARILVERKARGLWHRLKRLVSLLLMVLVLVLLLIALRDPRPADLPTEGRHVLILVDTSASMAARDMPGGRDRMEAARREALRVFDTLGPEDQTMVVRLDNQVRPLMPFLRPSAWMRDQIQALDFGATGADLPGALAFAARSLAHRSRPELVVITDGAFSPDVLQTAREVVLPSNVRREVIQVGTETGNVAINAFNVRRYPANRLNYEVFVGLSSSFEFPLTVELTLLANGRPVYQTPVELEAGGGAVRTYPNLATGGHRLEARIGIVAGDAVDVFPLDDSAFALLPQDRRTRVLIVSDDNLFVEAPFLLNQNLEVTRMSEARYLDLTPAGPSRDQDVTVFADCAPPLPDQGSFLFFNPTGEHSPWEIRGEVVDPIIDRFDRGDPLMRWMHGFRSVNIRRASRLSLSSEDRAVARTIEGQAMIVRRDEGQRRLVGVAFPLEESDFALRIAYPLFVLNALEWLTGDQETLVASYTTGRAWQLFTSVGAAETALLVPPVGEPQRLPIVDGVVTMYPEHPGFHELSWEVPAGMAEGTETGRRLDRRVLAVNFSDAEESLIATADLSPLRAEEGEKPVLAGSLAHRRDPWFYLVLAAAALLVAEWITFNRRMTV